MNTTASGGSHEVDGGGGGSNGGGEGGDVGNVMSGVVVGQIYQVQHMQEAGLKESADPVPFFCLTQHCSLWAMLEASCLVEGPPGSGKSTAVWFWLLRRVATKGHRVLWCHFTLAQGWLGVIVQRGSGCNTLDFDEIEGNPFDKESLIGVGDTCVIDGMTNDNSETAASLCWKMAFDKNWKANKNRHMIWVSSQQLVIHEEHLMTIKMGSFSFYSWAEGEVKEYALKFPDPQKEQFRLDVVAGTEGSRNDWDTEIDFDQSVNIKMHYFGCSARWLFGMPMEKALKDLFKSLGKVQSADKIQAGLSGNRSAVAVNHIIAMYPTATPLQNDSFSLASEYIGRHLSREVGLAAIRVMYSSRWVQSNPSVHGFVFEWDLLTRLEKEQTLALVNLGDPKIQWTWTLSQMLPLTEFNRNGVRSARTIVFPEKWNHPEYDGLYIHQDEQEQTHLVAWNASEAKTHSGKVEKLCVMLQQWAQRTATSITFASVRFLFIVPRGESNDFKWPSDSDRTQAKNLLGPWGFKDFEVWSACRSNATSF